MQFAKYFVGMVKTSFSSFMVFYFFGNALWPPTFLLLTLLLVTSKSIQKNVIHDSSLIFRVITWIYNARSICGRIFRFVTETFRDGDSLAPQIKCSTGTFGWNLWEPFFVKWGTTSEATLTQKPKRSEIILIRKFMLKAQTLHTRHNVSRQSAVSLYFSCRKCDTVKPFFTFLKLISLTYS